MQDSANEPLLFESQRPYAHDERHWPSSQVPAATHQSSSSASRNFARCQFDQQQNSANSLNKMVRQGRTRTRRPLKKSSSNNLLKSKSNRLEAIARASQLIGNFARFISTRNSHNFEDENINNNDYVISGGYSRHIEQIDRHHHHHHHRSNVNDNQHHYQYNENNSIIQQGNYLQRSKELNPSENYSLRCCGVGRDEKNKTRRLLSALFNDKQRNKSSLLISLLKAPIVLAALFSFILVVTLIVFYALSFQQHLSKQHDQHDHHYNQHNQHHHHLHKHHQNHHDLTSNPNNVQQLHRINGRNIEDLDDLFLIDSDLYKTSDDDADADGYGDNNNNLAQASSNKEQQRLDGLTRALTVQTECASYLGAPDGAGIVFKGIPFASPPIGRRRWKRPQPVWLDKQLCNISEIVEARQWKSHCAQVSPVTRRFSGHEDCLYLDIYTPRLDQDKKLPVMVYIHGGFLAFGSSGQGGVNWLKGHPSAQLASELQVVFVAFNYRLQALGFMTMLELSGATKLSLNSNNNAPDGSGEGNYGLWDQLVALNWIKRNIESFGGDPGNIVLFGPDSASSIALALLASPSLSTSSNLDNTSGLDDDDDAAAAATNNGQHIDVKWYLQQTNDTTSNGRSVSPESRKAKTRSSNQALPRRSSAIDRDLFRAVWLTNPTIYHELPYQLASLHYQRLFLNQSPCRMEALSGGGGRPPASSGNKATGANKAGNNGSLVLAPKNSAHPVESSELGDKLVDSCAQLNGSAESGKEQTASSTTTMMGPKARADIGGSIEIATAERIVQCLMNLSAEQVVRHYLDRDDPSYRLDDQNSLPIHGIFADQFVTVDRELVLRAAYPFESSSAGGNQLLGGDLINGDKPSISNGEANGEVEASNETKLAVLFNHNQPSEISDEAHYNRNNGNSKLPTKPAATSTANTAASASVSTSTSASASASAPASASAFESSSASSKPNSDDNCVGLICADRTHNYGPTATSAKIGKDLLIGSSAQAVEFWQCPRDLDQWNWIDFKRYVATSLNSLLADTFTEACRLYKLPLSGDQKQAQTTTTTTTTNISGSSLARDGSRDAEALLNLASPKETYLTMVSDIRQICPINELVASLRRERHRVQRYIVETRPRPQTSSLANSLKLKAPSNYSEQYEPMKKGESSKQNGQQKLEYAYHTWDLFAFFGFHFDSNFKASNEDLKFQAQIRKMVTDFVHRTKQSSKQPNSYDMLKVGGDSKQGEGYTLFEKDGSISRKTNDAHREKECAMWKRHLDTSYAWLS